MYLSLSRSTNELKERERYKKRERESGFVFGEIALFYLWTLSFTLSLFLSHFKGVGEREREGKDHMVLF